MLKYDILHQARYSRVELLLRTFFGWLYIGIPHFFLLFFVALAALFLAFLSWWVVLFTAKYPRNFFNFQVNLLRWSARVEARIIHLADGYPAFGLDETDPAVVLDIPYPERLSRGLLLLRTFFGWLYVLIPHGFILFFRAIATAVHHLFLLVGGAHYRRIPQNTARFCGRHLALEYADKRLYAVSVG
jgi:hypothetical protein